MFEKNCPYCTKPISVFSKGMIQGKFSCPHCDGKLKSRPNIFGIGISGGIGGIIGVMFHLSLSITVPFAIMLSYPFSITPVKSE